MERQKKYSYKREEIYRVICSTKSHPTAEWVYLQLKPQIPDLSMGTVYRNLAAFKAEGKVASVGVVAGQERFDGNVLPHTHFVCDRCSAMIDIDGVGCDEGAVSEIRKAYGAEATSYLLTFHGICKDCLAKTESPSSA